VNAKVLHGGGAGTAGAVPITHVVIIFQENHSFDNLFGLFCRNHPDRQGGCAGVTNGLRSDGTRVALRRPGDIVPNIAHDPPAQIRGVNGGKMNGFDKITGCGPNLNYACYTQYQRDQSPSLFSLASRYAISDHTFEQSPAASWPAHLQIAAATSDGFNGFNPVPGTDRPPEKGWGCDSFNVAQWRSPEGALRTVPSCVPGIKDGKKFGPYKPSPVKWVATIMDRLWAAQRSWRIYAPAIDNEQEYGYAWAVCPSFADCLYTSQRSALVQNDRVIEDAQNGTLRNFSIVIPKVPDSQHNTRSMIQGDNWVAKVVNAIGNGPDWDSTAVFVTYDDCGCFYDHLPPPKGMGIRVPMVIVSPYAKPAFTDAHVANYPSMLAYTEGVFGLNPLGPADANAYDFRNSFDYTQEPLAYQTLPLHTVPAKSLRYVAEHPGLNPDD